MSCERQGYRAFHDLCGVGYNIDHVLVGPAGVFAIETKFRSGYGEIEFRNGEGIFIGGHAEEKDCLKQARGNALQVNRIIKENCGINQWVKPLVVFVGNCKIRNTWRNTDARVFTADQVARYIREQQPELKWSEITPHCIPSGAIGEELRLRARQRLALPSSKSQEKLNSDWRSRGLSSFINRRRKARSNATPLGAWNRP